MRSVLAPWPAAERGRCPGATMMRNHLKLPGAYLCDTSEDLRQRLAALIKRVNHDSERRAEGPYHSDDDPGGEARHSVHSLRKEKRQRNEQDQHHELQDHVGPFGECTSTHAARTRITDAHRAKRKAFASPTGSRSFSSVRPTSGMSSDDDTLALSGLTSASFLSASFSLTCSSSFGEI